MSLVVQKYGGTSVANADRVKAVAERVVKRKRQGDDIIVVVSAPAGMTDDLIRRAKEISVKPCKRELDMLLAVGEQVSVALLAMAIKELGEEAISFNAQQIKIKTTNSHINAQIIDIDTDRIKEKLESNHIVIVCGFQGVNENDDLTTLGRGGSDTAGVALGIALEADLCEIYTDVDGVYTADPRMVEKPKKLDKIAFEEMLELSATGAKVLHNRSVELGYKYGLPIHLKSSFDESEGTVVCNLKEENSNIITGISHQSKEALIAIEDLPDKPGVAAQIFKKISEAGINVEIITQGGGNGEKADISFVTKKDDLEEALIISEKIAKDLGGAKVTGIDDLAMISLVGPIKQNKLLITSKVLTTLKENQVKPVVITGSDIKISFLIKEENLKKLLNEFHKQFIS